MISLQNFKVQFIQCSENHLQGRIIGTVSFAVLNIKAYLQMYAANLTRNKVYHSYSCISISVELGDLYQYVTTVARLPTSCSTGRLYQILQ